LATNGHPTGSGFDFGRLRPRRIELGLVLMVVVVVAAAYALASLGKFSSIPANLGPFLAWMLGLLVLAHLANRRLAPLADPVMLPLALLLNGIGYVMIARLGSDIRGGGDLAGLQSTWTAVGIGAYIATLMLVPRVRMLQQYRYLLGIVGLGLLLLPLAPAVGREIHGARIWVALGPINFQPGEFAKIALALFFAAYLVDKREVLRARLELRDLAPIALAWIGSLAVMVLERDLGSSLLFFALFVVLLWVAAERAVFLIVGLGLFSIGAVLAWAQFDHVAARFDVWLNPWADPKGDGFQIVEASFALADGGLTGTGLGRGEPHRIPFVESDFVFAAIGEELGLAGSVVILMAFLLLIGAGLRLAVQAGRTFETLLATGLTTLIGFQAFIIMGGVLRVVPLTGITLPFVSYGGSSLVANYVLLALLVRMSDEVRTEMSKDAST
jgi:peptidoglycan glycosyltransferase